MNVSMDYRKKRMLVWIVVSSKNELGLQTLLNLSLGALPPYAHCRREEIAIEK